LRTALYGIGWPGKILWDGNTTAHPDVLVLDVRACDLQTVRDVAREQEHAASAADHFWQIAGELRRGVARRARTAPGAG
jgi:hypothetical protein